MLSLFPDVYIPSGRTSPARRFVRWFRRHFTRDGRALARRLEACRP
jgi:hypothetical protein